MKKKNLCLGLFLLALAGLWTGCSNNEPVEDPANNQVISFRVQGSLPSPKVPGTTDTYMNAFVVNAYGDVTGKGANAKATMLATIVYRKEGGGFDYNPKVFYFAGDSEVEFSAYSPVSPNITNGLGKTGTTNTITYTVREPEQTKGDNSQEDLLVAYTKQVKADFSKNVTLNFKHALSRVYVTAKNKTSETVIIDSIKLVNLYEEGTLDIDATGWSGATSEVNINKGYNTITSTSSFNEYKVLWTIPGQQKKSYTYVLPPSGVAVPASTVLPTYVVSKEQGMLILPQTTVNENNNSIADPGDFYLEVSYRVSNITETAKIAFKDINNINPTAAKEGLTFEFGRQYALNISFDDIINQAISFDVKVEDWDTPVSTVNP
ncbi:MAG: fimbrillin family protein [Dysgonamonadaceae bacterium]|jgi:hypothetical protein|nr:fimbrillin family protein [Dysgonamonadaceae bacterium]